jgi:hypothetical protein
MFALCAAAVMSWGVCSCALEPSVDSPGNKTASLAKGMPEGLTVYEPSITREGNTIILTYPVRVSPWPEGGLAYMAQKAAASADKAEPQSIEALIWKYGANGTAKLFSSQITGVNAESEYTLKPTAADEEELPYVIIPLDLSRIKEYLSKRLQAGVEADQIALAWIEENPAIGKVENATVAWTDGKYEDTSIRINGLSYDTTKGSLTSSGTIDNFDDGADNRIPSIATVLADGYDRDERYTSTISFYTDSDVAALIAGLPITGAADEDEDEGEPAAALNAAGVRKWMETHGPVLRVVYRWAD